MAFSDFITGVFKVILSVICLCIFLLLIPFGLYKWNPVQYDYQPDSTWVETIGTLTSPKVTGFNGRAAVFNYRFDNIEYFRPSYFNYDPQGATEGEKVVLKVNPRLPNHFVPVNWKPIFLKGETTQRTMGRAISLAIGNGIFAAPYVKLKYTYTVKGQLFEREQELPPDYKRSLPQLVIGRHYTVEYLKKDPRRAIIHAEQQVTE